ncbi:MAG: FkbM family methyltransferase [Stellaceae bacterium]
MRRRFRLYQRQREGRLRLRLFGPHVAGALMRAGDFIYAIDIEDQAVRPIARAYEPPVGAEIARVAALIGPSDDVLVVGAHIGTVAIPVARFCRALWAIEANPRTFALLELNLKLNDAKNVHAVNIVVSDNEEEVEFVLSRTNSGGSKRMPRLRRPIYFYDDPAIVRLKARPLDELFPKPSFSLIFMDIEGSEYAALKGMQRILGSARALLVEFLPHHLRDVSGVTPEEFTGAIEPHFGELFVPSKNLRVQQRAFQQTLRAMYDKNEGDAGLVFTR